MVKDFSKLTTSHISLVSGIMGQTDTVQLKPLKPMTLFSLANRFLKLEFPVQRDYELLIHLAQKGFLSPQFSRQQLATLPLNTLEQLSYQVFMGSLTHMGSSVKEPSVLDWTLSVILAIEETFQYELEALVSEDLALMESHQKGSLHGYLFRPHDQPELFIQVLEENNYRADLFSGIPDSHLAYWLCRRLTTVFPWSELLEAMNEEEFQVFPYLGRFNHIRQFLSQPGILPADTSASTLVNTLLPLVYHWIANEFTQCSQKACIPRPIQELVLVEGSTETLLIPAVAEVLGFNLNAHGIFIHAVGGKNQMLQHYVNYAEHLRVPICILLDKDAQPIVPDLMYYQRSQDRIFVVEEGEFEDIYSAEQIVKTVNQCYQPHHPLQLSQLNLDGKGNCVQHLQEIWQELGLGLFDKVEFARHMAEVISHEQQISPAMRQIIERIIEVKAHARPTLSGE